MSTPRRTIDDVLASRRIIIACGTGGVGKTTVSAALALRAAMSGRKALVITIDPAKRLATSLGLEGLGDHAEDLTAHVNLAWKRAKASGLEVPAEFKGTFAALMPDTRRTFEAFVAALAPNAATADRVVSNPIFQIFAKEFSGTNEYMALERLYQLDQLKQYDLIVLDTPPSRNTLAFLDAPTLLARFFEEKIIKWLVLPANKLVAGGMRKALGILEKLTGSGFMSHLFDFAQSMFEVRAAFTENLRDITRLLESDVTGFLLVAAPTPDTAPEAGHFIQSVHDHGFHFDGVALNRTLGYLKVTEAERNQARTGNSPDAPLNRAFDIMEALQAREAKAIDGLNV